MKRQAQGHADPRRRGEWPPHPGLRGRACSPRV